MTPLQLAIREIDTILLQYEDPASELFKAYGLKKGDRQEAFVLALIGEIITLRKRLQAMRRT